MNYTLNFQDPKDGAILVFLPGMQEITTMYEQLQQSPTFGGRNKHKSVYTGILVFPLLIA